jgi:hypothetical protein
MENFQLKSNGSKGNECVFYSLRKNVKKKKHRESKNNTGQKKGEQSDIKRRKLMEQREKGGKVKGERVLGALGRQKRRKRHEE